jgi:hypothetical protein
MHLRSAVIAITIWCGLAVQPASAMIGVGGMNSAPYNSSAMAVLRDRQDRIKKCAQLPGFDSDHMTFGGRNSPRRKCP